MGVETTTKITCDECGADITNGPVAQLTISTQTTTPPPEPEEGQPPMPAFPVMESRQVTLCEDHAKAAQAKVKKLAPLPTD
jgi:hypothetical protein